MLVPILDKEDTIHELEQLIQLLEQVTNITSDVEIRWQSARLAMEVSELHKKFRADYLPNYEENNQLMHKNALNDYFDSDEKLLSAAFDIAATIDAARYIDFDPGSSFKNEVKQIRSTTLKLLHESR